MYISRIIIKNYKIFRELNLKMNKKINVFVGENDSGKTTILEAIMMAMTGKINGLKIMSKINADWFNTDIRNEYKQLINISPIEPPKIEIEVYFEDLCEDDTTFKHYKGTNNSLLENAYGIKMEILFNKEYSDTYKDLLRANKIIDIPIELYKIEYKTFSIPDYYLHNTSKRIALIDTTKKDYGSVLSKFISNSISMYLTEEDETNLSLAYRSNRANFIKAEAINKLNNKIREQQKFGNMDVSINLREGEVDDWKNEMMLSINDIPFENNGFGTQNIVKAGMVANDHSDVDFLILEEPENNLSFTNMSLLISSLANLSEKQLFISTHSSFVANKLSLNNLQLVSNGNVHPFNGLKKDTFEYFVKLPGYNTLRLLLANKIILVEGPADELIIQRAYIDCYGKLPIEDGVDVLAVGGIAFARYCELAMLIDKKITVLTDNDRNHDSVISKYIKYENILTLCVEENDEFNTLEPSVLNVNIKNFEQFKEIIYKGNDKDINKDTLLDFMINNKCEWAMRVFQSDKRINYPKYILKAIGAKINE